MNKNTIGYSKNESLIMNNKEPHKIIFDEFNQVDKQGWIDLVLKSLKLSDIDALVSNTYENIPIHPFYTPEDLIAFKSLQTYQHGCANTQNSLYPPRYWTNFQRLPCLEEANSNKLALKALNSGADGILFNFAAKKSEVDFSMLLENIQLPYCNISFSGNLPNSDNLLNYLVYAKHNFPELTSKINGFYHWDLISQWMQGNAKSSLDFNPIASLIKASQDLSDFKVLTVQGDHYHEQGANAVQELAFVLNGIVDYIDHLTKLGISAADVFRNLSISFSIGNDLFMEISKLRAFRILFDQLITSYNISDFSSNDLHIHCNTSFWTKTLFDEESNLLRNTTEAMAAIIGGCNSLLVIPHDSLTKIPSSFSNRIALNISNIIKEEAYLDKIVDPAAGSYYVENLTGNLVTSGWELFKKIEAKGGLIKSFQSNYIQQEIEEVRQKKHQDIASQKSIVVGTNQYPSLQQKTKPLIEYKPEPKQNNHFKTFYNPHRASEQFEVLRGKTSEILENFGNEPLITILQMGNDKLPKLRYGFINTFFQSAGFMTSKVELGEDFVKDMDAIEKDETHVIILCGSDETYLEKGIPLIERLKSMSSPPLIYLAGKLTTKAKEINEAGLTGCIYLNCDLIATIQTIHLHLAAIAGEEVKLK